ncbi:MAG: hypothetical protein JWP27_2250 [Flaviaesturariibacter sp.]|nr:hypothetical protein [Flaviaesturariibacter sp.]
MNRVLSCIVVLFFSLPSHAQGYNDSIARFQQAYVASHEVVKGDDRGKISFYPVSEAYCVKARMEMKPASGWFRMETTGLMKPLYRVYAIAHLALNGDSLHLPVYQSQDLLENERYRTYLMLPFTDATSGHGSYAGGRYLDFTTGEIVNGWLTIDFNKAYNPYCAYVSGRYNCPVPPAANAIPGPVEAGEKSYADH